MIDYLQLSIWSWLAWLAFAYMFLWPSLRRMLLHNALQKVRLEALSVMSSEGESPEKLIAADKQLKVLVDVLETFSIAAVLNTIGDADTMPGARRAEVELKMPKHALYALMRMMPITIISVVFGSVAGAVFMTACWVAIGSQKCKELLVNNHSLIVGVFDAVSRQAASA